MKIALVHEMLTKLGGAERVLKVFSDIFPNSPIYTLVYNKKTKKWFDNKEIKTSNLQSSYKKWGMLRFLLPKMSKAIEEFDFSNYDIVISSSSAFAHGIKTGKNTKHICYCHSPMRYAWDFTHEYTKNYFPLKRFLVANLLKKIRQWDYKSSDRADLIIANSKHVQKRIKKYWKKDSNVIYPPVDTKKFNANPNHEDYFLIVSALTPFKKIDLAIHTFNKIKRKLIIIGDGSQRKYLESIANNNIEFLGFKDDDIVKEYFENCRAFIFPGEEDFGITPVEAMSAGKPVLAYGVGGVTETVQAGISGEFFYEQTSHSFADGLARLLANENHYDYREIRKIAEKFDREVFEKKILDIVKNLSS